MGIFDDRQVTEAHVYGIQFISSEPQGAGVTVELGLSPIEGNANGPSVKVEIFVPAEKSADLVSIQEEAVDRALDLLERLVAEDRGAVKKLLFVPEALDFSKR